MKALIFLIAFVAICSAREWWENANYYQIYPRSFMDSTGNGVGDLNGIKSKAQYLKDLGMDGVWLSPIMKSPMADHGYDISDYKDIDATFGTMSDFDALLAEFKKVGVRLILDFVPNHSSNEHEWFIKSENKEAGYEDYYIWNKGIQDPQNVSHYLPPNNWISIFRGSAWTWSEKRQEYYYHAFLKEQPDLNYRNPKVVDEMKEVLRFWLRKGVAGFRVDAVPNLFEVEPDNTGRIPDEPLSGECDDPEGHCYLIHNLTQNLPETLDMVTQWREVLDEDEFKKVEPRVMMTEAYVSIDILLQYYQYQNKSGSHIPFYFDLILGLNKNSKADDVRKLVDDYINQIQPKGFSANWVLGNHDNKRTASRLGENRADLYTILLQTLPGHAVTYQGEEIAMPDGYVSWKDTQDPQACRTNETVYETVSRDPARTPMQWTSGTNAGFSKGTKTWLPVGESYKTVNVEAQEKNSNSNLALFKRLTALHKKDALRDGSYESIKVNSDTIAYLRKNDKETYLVVLNFGKNKQTLDITKFTKTKLASDMKVVAASTNSKLKIDSKYKSNKLELDGETGAVFTSSAHALISGIFIIISMRVLAYLF